MHLAFVHCVLELVRGVDKVMIVPCSLASDDFVALNRD
jgi:hypothetical protein